jgi:uncharacterized surface protein with fasciclin (FAS1) repeats
MTKLLDIAFADGRFYTFVDAVRAAGLVDAVNDHAPVTLLAPTDDAFAVLQPEGVSALLAEPDLLRRIILHHIIPGSLTAAQLLLLSPLQPLEGAPLNVRVEGDALYVADALVLMRDMEGNEGVMHAIDKLLTLT